MQRRAIGVAIALAWVAAPALGNEGVVEAVGEAMIKNGDTVAAKREATADALKKCIEQVVGISITTEFTAEQQESVKNNQTEFNSQVRDSLLKKSEGFIQGHEVLDEAVQGTVMKVKVRAKVYESKIKAEVQKLADLIAAAGNPKLVLVVQEVYLSTSGEKRVAPESVLGANLEKELLARGFELRGKQQAADIADESVQAYDKWLNSPHAAAKMARDAGADILVAGRVEIRDKGVVDDAAGLDALKGQTRIEITSVVRGVNAATGEVFSTKPVQMSSVGANVERAVHRAFKGRGSNVVQQTFDSLLEDLKSSFKKTAAQGHGYVVELRGIKSFRDQGRRFLEALQHLDGVAEARQKSFEEGSLVVDVTCKCTPNELQERIFSGLHSSDGFSSLDVQGVSGKKLSFKL